MIVLKNKLFWIFLIALFLRLFKLNEFPVGFHVDEVKVGWNALSILTTGADDKLNLWPMYYDSFGDFRPTGIFYITIPFLLLFDNSVFAVRFASSLFGALSIFPLYYLTYSVSKNRQIAFFSALLLSMSPWHLAVSRATSEVVISTFFALSAIYFTKRLIDTQNNKYLLLNLLFIAFSYLFYHSIRIIAPVYYLTLIFFYRTKISRKVILSFIGVIALTIYFSGSNAGLKRFGQVSLSQSVDLNYQITRTQNEIMDQNILSTIFDNKYAVSLRFALRQYFTYFGSEFLIGEDARPFRYTTPGAGLLTIIELLLIIVGCMTILYKKYNKLFLTLLLLSPLPAALTIEDAPNLHRSFFMLPFLMIIGAYGIHKLIESRYLIYILQIACVVFYIHMYMNHSLTHKPFVKNIHVDSPTYRNNGTIELVQKLNLLKNDYDRIVVTNYPDSPYPWYGFFISKNPFELNKSFKYGSKTRVIENEKIVFSEDKCPSDKSLNTYTDESILLVNNWECDHDGQIKAGLNVRVVDKIERPDGSVVFILLEKI